MKLVWPSKVLRDYREMLSLDEYEQLPDILKFQVRKLRTVFEYRDDDDDEIFIENLYELYTKYSADDDPTLKVKLFEITMLERISPNFLMLDAYQPYALCYNKSGHVLRLDWNSIMRRSYHYPIQGYDRDKRVIVKIYRDNFPLDQEVNILQRLQKLNCPVPDFSTDYFFWNRPVLVLYTDGTEDLTREDDPFVVAAQILQQLRYLHTFAIHNNLKPDGIRKKTDGSGITTYFISNFHSSATERLEHGYRRHIWSPYFCCQVPHKTNQVTTPKHDFIELGYTIKVMQNWSTGEKGVRQGYIGKLEQYMERCSRIDEKNVLLSDYDDLTEILNGKST